MKFNQYHIQFSQTILQPHSTMCPTASGETRYRNTEMPCGLQQGNTARMTKVNHAVDLESRSRYILWEVLDLTVMGDGVVLSISSDVALLLGFLNLPFLPYANLTALQHRRPSMGSWRKLRGHGPCFPCPPCSAQPSCHASLLQNTSTIEWFAGSACAALI